NPLSFPQIMDNPVFEIGGAHISAVQIAIITGSFLMMGALTLLVYRTRLGTAMRATSENPQVAGLMGININRVISATFVIGAGLEAFSAAGLGASGTLAGAMLGGILPGIVEALGTGYIGEMTDLCQVPGIASLLSERCERDQHFVLFGSNYQDVFAFVVLIAVL